eukprot:TRINITY_DN4490_c0_g2_i1.p1 TRINITY_DN4490_c0_g2~~TRINITY_DN4490_c0_g2_i1.p1  ORF type:complete len:1409 (+),score=154.44 TRINITY_DN4490_c0_g2_i1:33-4229(+)
MAAARLAGLPVDAFGFSKCSDVATFCNHAEYGTSMQQFCFATCGACSQTPLPTIPPAPMPTPTPVPVPMPTPTPATLPVPVLMSTPVPMATFALMPTPTQLLVPTPMPMVTPMLTPTLASTPMPAAMETTSLPAASECQDSPEIMWRAFDQLILQGSGTVSMSTIPCSVFLAAEVNPSGYYGILVWKTLDMYFGLSPSNGSLCQADMGELCKAATARGHGTDAACESFLGQKILESSCCACRYRDTEYIFDTVRPYKSEAAALVKVLETMGYDTAAASDKTLQLCAWPVVSCTMPSDHNPSFEYFLLLENQRLKGRLDASIGNLQRMLVLNVKGNELHGNIPPQLGHIFGKLRTLDLSHNFLGGSLNFSGSSANLLRYVSVASNNLSGKLDAGLFSTWNSLEYLDLSENSFEGVVPQINSSSLEYLNISVNSFTDWAGLAGSPWANRPVGTDLRLSFDSNKITSFPSALKYLSITTYFSLRSNLIDRLPIWGNFGLGEVASLQAGFRLSRTDACSKEACWWDYANVLDITPDIDPPDWPILRHADLSNNPVNDSLRNFLFLFAGAAGMLELHCTNCHLRGSLGAENAVNFVDGLEYTFVRSSVNCVKTATFPLLRVVGLAGNPSVSCRAVEIDQEQHPPIVCASCPQNMEVPPELLTPLQRRSDCRCKTAFYDYDKTDLDSKCGCEDGKYFDASTESCKTCEAEAEECIWGGDTKKSLLPPTLKSGFWAAPAKADRFVGHEIWRCASSMNCKVGGECVGHRTGRACSLCEPGHYGPPVGECSACPDTPAQTLQKMISGSAVISPIALVANYVSKRQGSRLLLRRTRALRTSLRQLCKYWQTLAIVGGFSIQWPSLLDGMYNFMRSLFAWVPSLAQVGCLGEQQTAAMDMAFKWSLPFVVFLWVMITSICTTALRGLCPSGHRIARCIPEFGLWDGLRVCVWGVLLLFPALLNYGVELMQCSSSPGSNRPYSVNLFPHIQCSLKDSEYAKLLPWAICFTALLLGATFTAVFIAWRQMPRALIASNFKDKGFWGFVFDCYRPGRSYWTTVVLSKDVTLNFLGICFAGYGASQLLLTSFLLLAYVFRVSTDRPFVDPSNTILEMVSYSSICMVCLVSAGMGFQREPGVQDLRSVLAGGPDSAVYQSRAWWIFSLQLASFTCVLSIVCYQLMMSFSITRKLVPTCLKPVSADGRASWEDEVQVTLELDDESRMMRIIKGFDAEEERTFRHLMTTSLATLSLFSSAVGSTFTERKRYSAIAAGRKTVFSSAFSRPRFRIGQGTGQSPTGTSVIDRVLSLNSSAAAGSEVPGQHSHSMVSCRQSDSAHFLMQDPAKTSVIGRGQVDQESGLASQCQLPGEPVSERGADGDGEAVAVEELGDSSVAEGSSYPEGGLTTVLPGQPR